MGKVDDEFLWPAPASSAGGGGGGERRRFQREWNEENVGLGVVVMARKMERGGRWGFIGGLGWRPEGKKREIGKERIPSSIDGRFVDKRK